MAALMPLASVNVMFIGRFGLSRVKPPFAFIRLRLKPQLSPHFTWSLRQRPLHNGR